MGYDSFYNYGIGMGMDSLRNDTCWQSVAQVPNINNPAFRGGSSSISIPDTTVTTKTSDPYTNGIDMSDVQTLPAASAASGLTTGEIVGGTALVGTIIAGAATYIAARKKGGSKGIMHGLKMIFGKADPTKAMKKFVITAKDGTQIIVRDGKIFKVNTMGEVTNLTKKADIDRYLRDNKLDKFSWCKTKKGKGGKTQITSLADGVSLTGYSFNQKVGSETYKFVVKDGKIEKIYSVKSSGPLIEIKPNAKDGKFKSLAENGNVQSRIESLQNGGTASNLPEIYAYKDEVSYNFTRKNGDIYSYTAPQKVGGAAKRTITVQPTRNCKLTEDQQKAWLQEHKDVETLVNEVIANGRADNVAREQFMYIAKNGDRVLINKDGEIVKVLKLKNKSWFGSPKGKDFEVIDKSDSTRFNSYLHDNEDVQTAAKEFFESGLATDGAQFKITE